MMCRLLFVILVVGLNGCGFEGQNTSNLHDSILKMADGSYWGFQISEPIKFTINNRQEISARDLASSSHEFTRTTYSMNLLIYRCTAGVDNIPLDCIGKEKVTMTVPVFGFASRTVVTDYRGYNKGKLTLHPEIYLGKMDSYAKKSAKKLIDWSFVNQRALLTEYLGSDGIADLETLRKARIALKIFSDSTLLYHPLVSNLSSMEKSLEKASTEVDKKSARIADIDTLVDFGSSSDKLVEERSKLVEQIKLIKDKKKQLEIDITTAKTIKPTIDANTKDREPYSKAVNDARKTAYEKNVNLFSMVQDYVKSEPLNGDLVKSVGLLIKDDGTRHYLTSTDGDKPRVALVNTETFTLLKLILAHEVDKLKSKK